MDAVSMIVMALATGAVAGLKPTAEKAVKDAYEGLKSLLKNRFSVASIEALEKKPESDSKQASVAEDVVDTGADKDEEVLNAALALIKLIESKAPEATAAVGIDFEKVRAAGSINIKDVIASGTGIRGTDWQAHGDVTIGTVREFHGNISAIDIEESLAGNATTLPPD